ncbi:MAG: hypothetical protein ABSA82_10660 [Thermacetogeniaceae bacterium]|jgi:hypothetical protein
MFDTEKDFLESAGKIIGLGTGDGPFTDCAKIANIPLHHQSPQ